MAETKLEDSFIYFIFHNNFNINYFVHFHIIEVMCSVLINILVSGELITYNDTLNIELKVLSSKFNTITKTSNGNLQYSVDYIHTASYCMIIQTATEINASKHQSTIHDHNHQLQSIAFEGLDKG